MLQYGEMTTLHLGSQTWILLNTKEVAEAIIHKNGRITNERPEMPIAGGLVSHDKRTVIRQTKHWTEGRRVMHHLLSGSVLKTYGSWQESASLQLLSSYLDDPERWFAHHFRYSLDVLYRVVMGDDLINKTQAELDDFQQAGMEFVRSLAQSMIDFFPILDKIPAFMQPWRLYWKDMGDRHRKVMVDWWQPVYAQVQAGMAGPSFVRDTLLNPDMKYKGNEEEAMYLAVSVMTAGGDNTRMSLNTFIMSMIDNPAHFAIARAQLDKVCGVSSQSMRLPGMQDFEQLPYISAIIKEVLRWRPTVPLVPPHQLTEDLQCKHYFFPAGVSFVINNVAIGQGVPEWDTYDPARWLDGTESNLIYNHWAFGGGRRICVGYRIAHQALWIAIARLIFCFDLIPVSFIFSLLIGFIIDTIISMLTYMGFRLENITPESLIM